MNLFSGWKFFVGVGAPMVVLPLCIMATYVTDPFDLIFALLAAIGLGFQLLCLGWWAYES